MSLPEPDAPCYLVEWYSAELIGAKLDRTAATLDESAASMSADGTQVHLLTMLSVPSDEVLFAVFEADSAPIVAQACARAGIPAHRLTPAFDAHIRRRTDWIGSTLEENTSSRRAPPPLAPTSNDGD
jgi:hypothetical protein